MQSDFSQVHEQLRSGGIIAYPTETVWGLGVNALDIQAVKKLFKLKARESNKPMSILVPCVDLARDYVEITPYVNQLMQVYWPGPVTFVLKKKGHELDQVSLGSDFLGVRCSSYLPLSNFIWSLDFPLTTTSANKSSLTPANCIEDLAWLPEDVFKVSGPASEKKASTVVQIENDQIKVLRQGEIEVVEP